MGKMRSQKGFSLFEVLIAISVFAVFFIVFATSFFHNQRASTELNQEMIMSSLAEKATRQIMLDLPALNDTINGSNKKENFDEPYKEYTYTIEWKKLELPNFSDLMNITDENQTAGNKAIIDKVFKQVQEATKNLIWQLRVTITYTPTKQEYPISLWVRNPDKELSLSGLTPKQEGESKE